MGKGSSMSVISEKSLILKSRSMAMPSLTTSSFASIAMSTLTSASVGGISGAALGLTSAVFDEFLIDKGFCNKHYLSNGVFWKATVISPLSNFLSHFFPAYGLPIYFTAHAVLGFVLPYFSDDVFDYNNKLQTPIESFVKINRLFDEKHLFSTQSLRNIIAHIYQNPRATFSIVQNYFKELAENKFLKAFVSTMGLGVFSLMINQVFLNFLASYDANTFLIEIFSRNQKLISEFQSGKLSFENLKPTILTALKILGGLILKNKLVWSIRAKKSLAAKEQERLVLERCTRIILEKGHGPKILSTENGKDLIYHMNHDFSVLIQQGSNKLIDVVTDSSEVVLALNSVSKLFESALVPFVLTIPFLQKSIRLAGKKIKELSMQLVTIQARLGELKADLVQNLDKIELCDGAEYIETKYNQLLNEDNRIHKQLDSLIKAKENNDKVFDFYNQFLGYAFYGAQVVANMVDLSVYFVAKKSIDVFYNFVMSNAHLQVESKELQLANEHVDKLFEVVDKPFNESIHRKESLNGEVVFKNYQLSIDEHPIVHIDHLVFEPGCRYAITGKSGCGKSSMLKDIKQGLIGGMKSSGEIFTPDIQTQPIMFLNQDLYFPKGSTLFEILCFPKIAEKMSLQKQDLYKERTLALFKELEIDEFVDQKECLGLSSLLDSTEFKLSGGQGKKVAIIQAILSDPSILILDETFTGLDKTSLKLVEKALLKYLPHAMILSVDHHAEDNNFDSFYQKRVHFENQTAHLSNF